MIRGSGEKVQFRLFGFMAVVLGAGDAFASRLLAGLATAAESDGSGCWFDPTWRSRTLHAQLPGAAEYAAQACLLSGSFGEGVPIPPEIQQRL